MIRLNVLGAEPIRLQVAPAVTVGIDGGGDPYEGEYVVTPRVEGQVLLTKDKTMQDDLTVKGIPYYEMDNQNGTTVYIGNEV